MIILAICFIFPKFAADLITKVGNVQNTLILMFGILLNEKNMKLGKRTKIGIGIAIVIVVLVSLGLFGAKQLYA